MKIQTEPIGSIPRPEYLVDALRSICTTTNQGKRTDDCGFSPFADGLSTSGDTAFAKIKSRIEGTKLAEENLF